MSHYHLMYTMVKHHEGWGLALGEGKGTNAEIANPRSDPTDG